MRRYIQKLEKLGSLGNWPLNTQIEIEGDGVNQLAILNATSPSNIFYRIDENADLDT